MEGGVLRARVTGRVGQGHGSCGPGSRGLVGQGLGSCRPGSRAMWVGVTGHVCQGHGLCVPGSRVMWARVTGPCGRGLSAHGENPWVSDESVTYSEALKKIILPLCGK